VGTAPWVRWKVGQFWPPSQEKTRHRLADGAFTSSSGLHQQATGIFLGGKNAEDMLRKCAFPWIFTKENGDLVS